MSYLLKNCRLIPELSSLSSLSYAHLEIQNGKIHAIHPVHSTVEASEQLDCQGRTLLPGLFDLHTHVNWSYVSNKPNLTDFSVFLDSCLSAQRYLKAGFTTIRDMGSPKRVSISVRSAIAENLFLGPRILSGGIILRPLNRETAAHPYHFLRYVSGTDEMLRCVREEIGVGADWIKLYVNNNPPDMLPEEVRMAVRVAGLHGKKVAAHAHDLDAIHLCLDEGVYTIEHGSYIDDAGIEKLAEGKAFLVPTLATLSPLIKPSGFTQEMVDQYIRPLLEANQSNISKAYRAGLKLGFGTDTPIETYLQHPGLEFRMRKEYCGMSNLDMLLQATKYSAEIAGLSSVTGEIKVGLAADLILVDGNPDQDISVMYKNPDYVFVGGKLVKSDA